jgi:hypothetical protein
MKDGKWQMGRVGEAAINKFSIYHFPFTIFHFRIPGQMFS